ncbi:RNA polymerase sigma factor FliA [Aquitalea sp. S1-19]|nr:RNA polymerase sigma factor FliA [Aquitalea sp. S1-19]
MALATHQAHAYAQAAATDRPDVMQYTPLVRKIASLMMARLPASVELDDLVQVGMIGLLEAARQFDPLQGVQFETFAGTRIKGAMLDELRRIDWMPRQLRRNARMIEDAIKRATQTLGYTPSESEIADELAVSLEDYQAMLGDCMGVRLVYFEDFHSHDGEELNDALANIADDNTPDPLLTLADSGFRQALIDAIATLPERDQLVMSLYYEQDLNLKEIGAVLGVSESRVSQLHTQAVTRIRSKLREWL